MNIAVDAVKQFDRAVKHLQPERLPDGGHYHNIYDFVIKNGMTFAQDIVFPDHMLPPKNCFLNCYMVATAEENCLYCEGYATGVHIPFPIHHAWILDLKFKQIIDPTTTHLNSYFGIPFQTSYLRKHWDNDEVIDASLIDNLKGGYPLFKKSPDDLKKEEIFPLLDLKA